MKKDVIYIDIEDDITSIIDKVKNAGSGIVALVPPKRVGVLQSAVNLKLLHKAAEGADKRVVLITSDHGLSMLAAGVKIPVAKNLQSRPELASVGEPQNDDEEDIINGADLPVGEFAKKDGAPTGVAVGPFTTSMDAAAKESSDSLGSPSPFSPAVKSTAGAGGVPAAKKSRFSKSSIPNFDSFRKRLFIFGGLGILLIAFLVWAVFFAPKATVTITAKTSTIDIGKPITLDPNTDTNPDSSLLKIDVKQVKKSASTEFDTTGKKEVGERAKGTVNIRNCDSSDSFTIAAGTTFLADSGQRFTNVSAVTVPGLSGKASICRSSGIGAGTADAAVTAEAIGPEYNIAPSDFQIGGVGGDIYASSSDSMSGGTREQVEVVAAADVEKAKEQLKGEDAQKVRSELEKQFSGDVIIIKESFKEEAGRPNVSPAIGEQAKRARLTIETTYTIFGAERDDVKLILNDVLNANIEDKQQQRIYSSGDKKIKFSEPSPVDGGLFTTRISTTGYIGPVIDDKKLAEQVAGKRYGEIEQLVNDIEGVEGVDIKFSPFWVNKAPGAEKVVIKYTVKNNE